MGAGVWGSTNRRLLPGVGSYYLGMPKKTGVHADETTLTVCHCTLVIHFNQAPCHRTKVIQLRNWHCQLLSTACPSTCDNVTSLYSWFIPHLVANSRLAGQEITRLVWNPKVYYRILKGPPLGPSGSMSVQSAPSNPLPSDFNITLPSTPSAPNLCPTFSGRSVAWNYYLSHACTMHSLFSLNSFVN